MSESIIRLERRTNFTMVQNDMLQDPRLSLKTKGLFAWMLSKPDSWDFSVSGLAVSNNVGKDAIRSSLKELEAAGYLTRQQAHGERGHFSGNVYILREVSSAPLSDNPTTVEPTTAGPTTGGPSSVDPTQDNIDLSNKDLSNTPPKVPQGGRRKRGPKKAPDWKPERFAAFWAYYAKHARGENPAGAAKAWDKLQPSDELIDIMGRALVRQVSSEAWKKGIGIPYASTWLNNARWEDVPLQAPPSEAGARVFAKDPEVF